MQGGSAKRTAKHSTRGVKVTLSLGSNTASVDNITHLFLGAQTPPQHLLSYQACGTALTDALRSLL